MVVVAKVTKNAMLSTIMPITEGLAAAQNNTDRVDCIIDQDRMAVQAISLCAQSDTTAAARESARRSAHKSQSTFRNARTIRCNDGPQIPHARTVLGNDPLNPATSSIVMVRISPSVMTPLAMILPASKPRATPVLFRLGR